MTTNASEVRNTIYGSHSPPEYRLIAHFQRNYTILILVVPLLAIFYLLGAIFIFDNSMDQIGNRLTLTLGIYRIDLYLT